MKRTPSTSLGVGLLAYLLCVLVPVACKLLGYASYGWWNATVALWAPVVFTIVVAVLYVVVAIVRWVWVGLRRKALRA